MPHHASAKKRMKTNARDRAKNKSVKSLIRRANQDLAAVMNGAAEDAEKALRKAHSVLDKAAKKGVIPKPRADRKKARLARAVHKAQSK
ncbi:MAG: 30S ribosomal protein S20 [Candidatus Eisenbacteria bacterium]|uniref:Small ribosomal subunit protein bS20 n=1 Tax=Eiseniibacteriota bacterium TaxID=2212470 RepID=A0A956SDB9_UNCEI|nr:30S ribosomal protein S20 [Candidatus Eisenbacteria bacterium]MCB9462837.1 30S ribosomal protein S20 [Candidatus Eisenbacteria bacterium]